MDSEYRFSEEDEARMADIAQDIGLHVIIHFAAAMHGSENDDGCLQTLEDVIDTINACSFLVGKMNQKGEDILLGEELPELPLSNGYALYRNYELLKEMPAVVVMISETALAAEKRGYTMRVLKEDKDIKAAQISLESCDSFQEYRQHLSSNFPCLAKEFAQVFKKKPLNSQVMHAKPIIIFEKEGDVHYLALVEDSVGIRKSSPFLRVFSERGSTPLNDETYFSEIPDYETFFDDQFLK